MRRILALAILPLIVACEGQSYSDRGGQDARSGAMSEVLTYSDPCRTGGMDNWVLVSYQGGIEEMLTHAEAVSAGSKSGGLRIEVNSKSGSAGTDSSGRGLESSSKSGSGGSRSNASGADQKSDQTAGGTRSDTRGTDQGSDSTTAKTRSESTRSDQSSDESAAKTKAERSRTDQGSSSDVGGTKTDSKGTDVDTRGDSFKSESDASSIDQRALGRLVIWAKNVLETLRRNKVDVQGLRARNVGVLEMEESFVVNQEVALIKVVKGTASDRIFDELLAGADASGGRVYVYSLKIRNISKHALNSVKVIDLLPEGLDLDRKLLSEPMKKACSGQDGALFDVFSEGSRTGIVWGVRDSIPSGGEITLTFGVVKR